MRRATPPALPFLEKSASDGFAAVRNAVAVIAAMWSAGFVHRFNHAGFQQRARRGEGDSVPSTEDFAECCVSHTPRKEALVVMVIA